MKFHSLTRARAIRDKVAATIIQELVLRNPRAATQITKAMENICRAQGNWKLQIESWRKVAAPYEPTLFCYGGTDYDTLKEAITFIAEAESAAAPTSK